MSLLCNLTGVEMTHVPYRGSGPAIADLIAGSVQLTLDSPPSLLPQIRSGKLRAIAVTGLERTPELPDVPTIAEVRACPAMRRWAGIRPIAPVGSPAAIVTRLNEATNKVLADPQVKERIEQAGARTRPLTPAQVGTFLKAEVEKWAPAVRKSGAQID